MKKITLLMLMLISYSGFAQFPAPYCGPLAFATDIEPITLVNFAGINNATSETVNGTPDHEDYTAIVGNVTAGSAYTITLEGNTAGSYRNRFMVFADWNQDGDFDDADEAYTITQTIYNSTGVDAIQATQSLQVPPTALVGTTRMRVKKIFGTTDYTDPCLGTDYGQVEDYSLTVAPLPPDLPDNANLQSPYTATINQGDSFTVYGQVYEGGLTDVDPNITGQAPGIQAWVGYSTTDTNPNTWTNWVPATWNSATVGNNDEYQASIGSSLVPATYYYATRFQLNGGAYVYGGTNNGFWNGTDKINGVLTVNPPVAPANDDCSGAFEMTFDYTNTQNAVAATNNAGFITSCSVTASGMNDGVWYTFLGNGGDITIALSAVGSWDPQLDIYSGTCGSFTCVASADVGFSGGAETLTVNSTNGLRYYVNVGYWSAVTNSPEGLFTITATSSLANSSFDNNNFTYYPNPVKNTLNLSYNQEISNVTIFNLMGQKVSSHVINSNQGQVDMSNMSNGVYLVKVTSNNQVKTFRVIKE